MGGKRRNKMQVAAIREIVWQQQFMGMKMHQEAMLVWSMTEACTFQQMPYAFDGFPYLRDLTFPNIEPKELLGWKTR
eukprot:m.179691 g.179691  ORF g.179691 m.179691 type:complete len:77 (+) comp16603_c2_seq1:3289-3519(+)